jgi:hypothetical protein
VVEDDFGVFHTNVSHSRRSFKLSNFERPDWDPSHIRQILDLSLIFENIVSQLEQIQAWQSESGNGEGHGLFIKMIPALRQYKQAFENRRAATLNVKSPPSMEMSPITMDDLSFGLFNEAFWLEMMANWNSLPPTTKFCRGKWIEYLVLSSCKSLPIRHSMSRVRTFASHRSLTAASWVSNL